MTPRGRGDPPVPVTRGGPPGRRLPPSPDAARPAAAGARSQPLGKGARGRERGFTLLELLVAITLLGLIAVMGFSGLRLGTRAWEAADERENDVYLVQQLLRARLAVAHAPSEFDLGVLSEDGAEPLFAGDPDRVSFVTPLPDLFGVGGLYRVTVEVVEADGGGRRDLVLSWRLWRPEETGERFRTDDGPDEEAGRNRRVLLDGIEHAEFAFFGPAADLPGEPVWQDDWDGRPDLPALVRLTVEHPEKDWPALVVAPRLGEADPWLPTLSSR